MRLVMDALRDENWLDDIQGVVSVESLLEYLNLLDLLESVVLQEGVPDKHIWRLSSSETYSAKSAYGALFEGSLSFAPYERIWKSWAPPKCHFFHVAGRSRPLLDNRQIGPPWASSSRPMLTL